MAILFVLYFLSSGKHPVSLFNGSCVVTVFDFAAASNFKDGTGDGVVSKRVMPSNKTCVLMSSLSGSSLNMNNIHTFR